MKTTEIVLHIPTININLCDPTVKVVLYIIFSYILYATIIRLLNYLFKRPLNVDDSEFIPIFIGFLFSPVSTPLLITSVLITGLIYLIFKVFIFLSGVKNGE